MRMINTYGATPVGEFAATKLILLDILIEFKLSKKFGMTLKEFGCEKFKTTSISFLALHFPPLPNSLSLSYNLKTFYITDMFSYE